MKLRIEKMALIAKQTGLDNLARATARAVEENLSVVNLDLQKMTITQPKTVCIQFCLNLDVIEQIKIPQGESDLCLLLVHLGLADDLTVNQHRQLIGIVAEVAAMYPPLVGLTSATVKMSEDGYNHVVLPVNVEGLTAFRQHLCDKLSQHDLPVYDIEDWEPVVDLMCLEPDEEMPAYNKEPIKLRFDEVDVEVAGKRYAIKLTGETETMMPTVYAPVVKASDEELRYTFSPWYVPNTLDAHNEWADDKEVQMAFWKYLALDDRDIRLQHNLDVRAGRWVEGATIPFAFEYEVITPDGPQKLKFPANTPFLGIIWEPWAWKLVKSGAIRGLSIGGKSKRMEIALEKSVVRRDGKYVVTSQDGSREFGTYDTEQEALDRLAQIERFKHMEKAAVSVGDYVRWGSSGGNAQGKITRIVRDGKINVPDSSFTIQGTEDDPALLIRIYHKTKDGWKPTETLVGHKSSTVNRIEALKKD